MMIIGDEEDDGDIYFFLSIPLALSLPVSSLCVFCLFLLLSLSVDIHKDDVCSLPCLLPCIFPCALPC